MDKLKDPAMLLSIINSIGLIGNTYYFYKQLEIMRADIDKIQNSLKTNIKRVGDLEKKDQIYLDKLQSISDQLKNFNESIANSVDNLEDFGIDMDEIISVLEENSIVVERPSLSGVSGRSRRSGDRRNPVRLDRREIEDTSSRRHIIRERTPVRETRQPKPQHQRYEEYDRKIDDADVIGDVRKQQKTAGS